MLKGTAADALRPYTPRAMKKSAMVAGKNKKIDMVKALKGAK